MRVKFLKYGKRMLGENGQSEYFEVSAECGPLEDPVECAQKAKAFVRAQLAPEPEAPLRASLGERVAGRPGSAC